MDSTDPSPALSLLDRNNGHQIGLRDLSTVLSGLSAPSVDKSRSDIVQGVATMTTPTPAQPTNSLTLKPPPTEHIRKQYPSSLHSSPAASTPLQISPHPPTTKPPVLVPTPSSAPTTSLTTSSLPRQVTVPSLPTSRATLDAPPRTVQSSLPHKTGSTLKNSVLPSPTVADSGPVDPRNKCNSHKQISGPVATTHGSSSVPHTAAESGNSSTTSGRGNDAVPSSNLKSDRTSPTQNSPPIDTQPASNPKNESPTDTPSPSSPSLTPQVSWLTDGPSSAVLTLSSRKTPSSPSSSRPEKEPTDIVSVITSQFLQHSSGREETSGGGGATAVRVSDQLSSLQAGRPVPLALNRELQLSIVQGTVPMTSSRLPSSLPPTPITPKLEGHPQIFDKRTVSSQNLVARRASATTNGSNYPEIFHTARRYSDTSERGLKQALAG